MRNGSIWMALAVAASSPGLACAASPPRPPAAAPAAPTAGAVSEVVITGQAAAVQTGVGRRSYSVAQDLQAQAGSIGDALRNVPSVEVDVAGNVSLRGDPNVTILIDGKPSNLFEGDNKGQALQQMPADRIARVEVITNPSAEFRADGTGGIINLVTKTTQGAGRTGSLKLSAGDNDRLTGAATLGFNAPNLTLSGDLGFRRDFHKQVIGEDRAQPDPLGGVGDTRQDQLVHLAFDALNARSAVDYDLDPRTRIGAQARFNGVDFDLAGLSHFRNEYGRGATTRVFDRGLAIHQERGNGQLDASLRRRFAGAGHEFSLNFSYEATRDDRVRAGRTADLFPAAPETFDQQRLDYDLRRTELKGDYVRPMAGTATLKAGFDLQHDDNRYSNRGFRGPSPAALAPDPSLTNLFLYDQQLIQAYATYERPFGDLTVLAGLRLEDVRLDLDQVTQGRKDQNDYFKAYPSLHLAWALDDERKLTASYSHRVQRPTPDDLNAFRFLLDPLNYRAGNPHLKPQETQSFELGYERRQGASLLLATLYYRETFNRVADVVSDLGGGVLLSTRENVSKSRNAGLELVSNGRLSKTLTYGLSVNGYWNELDAEGLGASGRRSGYSAFGRANLNWQATGVDFVQLSGFVNGKRLTPQGYYAPSTGLDLGWRHKLDDKVSLLVTGQDILGTYRERQVVDTPGLKSRLTRKVDSRMLMVGFTWALGGGKAKDPGFDFQADGSPPSQLGRTLSALEFLRKEFPRRPLVSGSFST